jgi:hypothetical protein
MDAVAHQVDSEARAGRVEWLRERIRKLEAQPRQLLSVIRTGVEALDALLPHAGLPLGQAVELWGEAASGRTTLSLRAVAAAQRAGRLCAWVDGPGELYPPAAAALGVDLRSLLVVRPRAPGQLVWSAQQLCRSGAFACVVLDVTHTGVRMGLPEGKKLSDAAHSSGTLLLLLTQEDAPADGMLRLHTASAGLHGISVEVVRSRSGGVGRRVDLPWPALWAGVAEGVDLAAGARPPEAPPPADASGLQDMGYGRRPEPGFQRVKKHDLRNGGPWIRGGRPGRDGPVPDLEESAQASW